MSRQFATLFPQLFGGGQAKLELTGEEILDAGIQIIAQPPGKKNASIHLLSGGEKALTAIALVFSLFQLNPAPFCIRITSYNVCYTKLLRTDHQHQPAFLHDHIPQFLGELQGFEGRNVTSYNFV